jgi:FkbH-like protein
MRTRLISNTTIAPLLPYLGAWTATAGEVTSLIGELVDPASPAAADDVTHVVCIADADSLVGTAAFDAHAPNEGEVFLAALERFAGAHPKKTIVVTTLYMTTMRTQSAYDVIAQRSPRSLEAQMNEQLIALARTYPNLLLLDVERLFRRFGEDALLNEAFWYAARLRYTPLMLRELAGALDEALRAYAYGARKVLVLDLDNTLWGGVLGETGPLGIALGESGAGLAFRELQRALLALKSTGTLLALCSKNNPDDVADVFATNRLMLLGRDDFAAVRVGWGPKPDAIVEIAQALDLGLDSFVFIDDNPVERAAVRAALPEVAVPEFPARPEHLLRWFTGTVVPQFFAKYRVTGEDAAKTEQYRAGASRRELARAFDLDGFIAGLEVRYTIHRDAPALASRMSQMTQKTNQFNLTTRRCEVTEIMEYQRDPDKRAIALEYGDRFGEEGVVALALLDLAHGRIDNVVMSCRVIGRRVEDRLMREILADFRERGTSTVTAEFIPTAKNVPAANYLPAHGFTPGAEVGGHQHYELTL